MFDLPGTRPFISRLRRGFARSLTFLEEISSTALTVVSALGLLIGLTVTQRGLMSWLTPIAAIYAGFSILTIVKNRKLSTRLNGLAETVREVAQNFDEAAPSFEGRGDEADRLSHALDVLRKNSRRAMLSEANLRAAVENMVEGIIMISADGRVALHNQKLLKIFGLPPMNAIGQPRAKFNAMLVEALHWPQSAQDYLQKQLTDIRSDGHYRVFDVELPNNRVLRYSAFMLSDGHVMSYIEDISEQRAAAASILHLAHYDTLTGLPNRALFQERFTEAIETAEREPAPSVTLLLCDLDRFKAVNDTYGHPVGDELLRQATRRMRAQVRADNIVARLGGDEFAVIYLSQHDQDGAEGLARRLVACLEQPFEIKGHEVSVGISIGIAVAKVHATSVDDLMIAADLALYAAKQEGRNRHKVYEPAMSMFSNEYGGLESSLRKALENNSLHLYYQPQVELKTRRIIGFEALARWDRAERGTVPSDTFIAVAEKSGLIVPLGAWVLRRACRDALAWSDDIMLSVNVAPQQLRAEGFVDMVVDILAQSGLKAARLELEITESAPLHDDETILTVLKKLAIVGVRVSMDDFGKGNTGLSYLQKFRFNKLKIDQSFVSKLGEEKEAELIVNAIVELSASLNVQVVAEGIETEQQAAVLLSMNCTIGQGFLFGRPAPLSVATNLVAEQNTKRPNDTPAEVLSLGAHSG